MEVRDIWPQTLVDMNIAGPRHPLVRYLGRLEKRLYSKAEFIITPLPLAHKYFSALGIPSERILFLPQGTQISDSMPALPERSAGEPFTVMYVGSFGPADYVDVLVKSARALSERDIRFVFVGDGEIKAGLVEWASTHRLSNVTFLDPVPKNLVQGLLGQADACLISVGQAQLWQRYGMAKNKLIDYLAAARPIIFAGEIPQDIVADAGCGLSIKPGDPALVAEAVETMASFDYRTRQEMGARGWRYLAENHAIPILVDKLEGLWKSNDKGNQPRELIRNN
jgi:glycosyltransferase involved in cell wall biosynthesis